MATRGFTLLEVMIALAILSVSLAALLQTQAASLDKARRSRELSVATLLCRNKMIDIEQRLFHDGLTTGTEQTDGNFADAGFADYAWKARIAEVRLDMSRLMDFCGNFSGPAAAAGGGGLAGQLLGGDSAAAAADGDAAFGCEAMLSSITASLGGFMEQIGASLRTVELTVCWGEKKQRQRLSLRALLSRDDFNMQQQADTQRDLNNLQQAGGLPGGGLPGGGGLP